MFWTSLPDRAKAALVIIAVTLATRAWLFGNPVVHVDDQFYLLVGQRMVDGDLPYVDIFDRKPIGLFLIYALANWLFPGTIAGYQLFAAASVALTAWLLFGIARQLTSLTSALAAAAAYIAWLPVFAGVGGQAPVFYNLLMIASAAQLLAMVRRPDGQRIAARGAAIMLLCGIAMQIKYSALFDGVFFGLTLLWLAWHRGWTIARLAGTGLGWIGCALAPTLAVAAAYAAIGHGSDFVQANFVSILRDTNSSMAALARLAALSFGLTPFWVCVWVVCQHRGAGSREIDWILAWTAASSFGFVVFGVYFDHYVLPLLLPLCLVAALAFDRLTAQRWAIALVFGLGLLGGLGRVIFDQRSNGSARQVAQMAATIRPLLGHGCLYMNEELPILYWLTHSCLPTRYVFPDHLILERYEHALGVDQLAELRRILRQRPSVIVKSTDPNDDTRPASRAILEQALRQDYRLAGQALVGGTIYLIYVPARRDLPKQAGDTPP